MLRTTDRRSFLKNSATSLIALGSVGKLAGLNIATAKAPASDGDVESVMRIIESTPRDRIAPVLGDLIRKGLTREELLEALFLTATRISTGHNVLVHHSVSELSSHVDRKDQLLPLFWHIDIIKAKRMVTPSPMLEDSQLPKPGKAPALFQRAVQELDQDAASAAIIAIARSEGPQAAFRHIWTHAAGSRLLGSIGHSAIRVANSWRSMDRVGWQYAERPLNVHARVCSSRKNLTRSELHLVNLQRSARHEKLPGNWMNGRSDEGAVVELHAMYDAGNAADACESVFEQLRAGKISPASLWDAVFLTTTELSVRYKFGGPSGRPRHAITSSNAMHFIYRTWTDPQTRLFTLLQAVAMTCSFVDTVGQADDLNDFDITSIREAESPASVEDAVAEIFSLLPPRRSEHRFRDRSGQDKALELTYAMAQQHSDRAFLRTARSLLCRKCSIDAHHLKFPIAAFENYRFVSPKWRPNYLAASVFVLQGTEMEDNPAVQEAQEALRGL